MGNTIKFKIDGKECTGEEGQMMLDAAADNGIYIPNLCHLRNSIPAGSCRLCTIKMNGRPQAACTTPLTPDCNGMVIESNTPELIDLRKTIVELLFVEGNHFCPSCEKSGNCDLQGLAYRFQMMVPQFPYTFPPKDVDAEAPKIYLDRNRCILCKKCIRSVKSDSGKNIFAFFKRGAKLEIRIDHELAASLTDEQALKAMEICPVGAILKKEIGFKVPIGKRKYDTKPIGSDIENK